jgi:2-phosphoglycerate kinase
MTSSVHGRSWQVLVVFGASGSGKSTAAREIALEQGVTWLQVDDLRLALQYSQATLPNLTDELYFFESTPDLWSLPTERLCRAFVQTAMAMLPAVRVVIDSHVVTRVPIVIEGDGIFPALVEDPVIAPLVATGVVRFCCVAASGVEELLDNMINRGRGEHVGDREDARPHALANDAYNTWLVAESERLGIPVVSSRPYSSLAKRIVEAVSEFPG